MLNIRAEKCNHVGNAYDLVVKKGVKKRKHMKLLGTPKMIKKKKSQPRETFKLILYKLFPSTNLPDSTPSRRLAGFLNFSVTGNFTF